MRVSRSRRLLAALAGLALALTACGGDDNGDGDDGPDDLGVDEDAAEEIPDGPDITVASFNFPESQIVSEIYAQTLEEAGYPVERQMDLGARELVFPELQGGNLDLLPEYLGSAIVVGFDEEAPEDIDSGVETLSELFGEDDISVLEPAPAESANVFVTTSEFAEENGLSAVSDLADAGDISFSGPPECQDRETCFGGLQDIYGLDNVEFEAIQETSARVQALEAGQNQLTLLFSTDAILGLADLQVLDDDEDIVPPENITPILRDEIIDAYGDDLIELLDGISALITTDVLIELNIEESEGIAPAEVASDWLGRQ
jgi:osmoprotectant transport system substrate-binding protein